MQIDLELMFFFSMFLNVLLICVFNFVLVKNRIMNDRLRIISSTDGKIKLIEKSNHLISQYFDIVFKRKYEEDLVLRNSIKNSSIDEDIIEENIINISEDLFKHITVDEKSLIMSVHLFQTEEELLEHIVRETRNRLVRFLLDNGLIS